MLTRLIFVALFMKCLCIQGQNQLENFTKDNVLTSNQITCYLVDSKGLVWIGTESGLNAYSAGKWYPIKAITNNQTGKDVQLGRIETIYEDKRRNIWVSSINGLFIYNGNSWVHYLQDEEEKLVAKDFMEDRSNRIWIGLENTKKFEDFFNLQVTMVTGIIYMYNYETWFTFGQMSGNVALKYNIPPKFFTSILQDKEGNIWISSLEGLFRFYSDKMIEIEEDDLRRIKTFGAIQDLSGDIWVATELGIFRYSNNTWMKYGKKEGLSGDFFYDIVKDPRGRIWAFSATDMKFTGLSMNDGKNWMQFDSDAINLKGTVNELFFWEEEIFAFSNNGVSRFDSTGWHRFDRKDGLNEKSYSFMFRNRFKDIFLVGEKAFFQFENMKWVKMYEPPGDWVVTQIFTDKKRRLWVATESSGVFQFADNKWEQLKEEDGLPDDYVSGVFEDKTGNIWFITKKGIAKTNF
ncbi:MAG TPA: two-component regulator propeller domain-containing protein [Bacteroidales bacterium]